METASGDSGPMPQLVKETSEVPMPKRRKSPMRVLLLILVPLVVLLAVGLSFLDFAHRVGSISTPADPRADAIVVLTGGTDRVERAVSLLSQGRAMRLLISGVHPVTTRKQIARMTSADMPLFDCCVDLDKLALNTAGNATETAAWVRLHEFKSLLLVTSAYHLPRAQVELAEVLPDVKLLSYPVYPAGLDLKSWYLSPQTVLLLMREYVKYSLARLRILVAHTTGIVSAG